jgi:hypothetical protein
MPIFKRPKPSDDAPPSDEKVAKQMRYLAGLFIQGAAKVGDAFAFDTDSALRLDGYCEELLDEGKPAGEAWIGLTNAMAAYLGELVVRNGRGRWVYSHEAKVPAVQLPSGRLCFPLHKVAKRLAGGQAGRENSLWVFYEIMMTGVIPADAKVTPRYDWPPQPGR